MKKNLSILLVVTLASFQCSKDEVEPDCGCDSETVVKELIGSNATLEKIDLDVPDRIFYIRLDEKENSDNFFHVLVACDSRTFSNENFQDGSRVKVSGDIRPICRPEVKSMPGTVACFRFVTARMEVKEVELIER